MRYYLVKAKFGHVSQNGYIIKTVPTAANSGKEAAYHVRHMPRVKHHDKYAILSVVEITKEEYDAQLAFYREDPYFKATNKQEQNSTCSDVNLNITYYCDEVSDYRRTSRRNNVAYRMKKFKILNKESSNCIRNYSY